MGSIGRFDVWYLSGEKAESDDALVLYDDSGTLAFDEEVLEFKGSKMGLRIDRKLIGSVSLSGTKLSLRRALLSFSIGIAMWLPIILVALLISIPIAIILDNWLTVPVCLVPPLLIALVSVMVSFLAGRSAKWAKVDYTDQDGKKRSAYFADRSGFGLRGYLGGTKRLCEMLSG